ncbi:MAG: trimethylamine methyltransferase family protein, partial [Anaerolineae bacterium]|nr:trimethylamine methyltransferase family protein [Anaerolineae bacterium]
MARPGPEGGQYRPLTDEQVREVHRASLAVLETTGILVENDTALRLYREGGASVDGHRVRIPPTMVDAALKTVP